jgi:hypothetical protein
MSYQERKAKGLAQKVESSLVPNTANSLAGVEVGGFTMYNNLEFLVDNLTGINLKVEFVGKVITIKEVK